MRSVYFSTVSIKGWHNLFHDKPMANEILIKAIKHYRIYDQISVFAFVIMPNHFHILWQSLEPFEIKETKHNLLKFTGQEFRKHLMTKDQYYLELFESRLPDREYHFWSEKSRDYPIYNNRTFLEKLRYIHLNPVRTENKLVDNPSEYKYSSARFYEFGIDSFGFLSTPPIL